jgi:hypothetical protein
VSSCRETIRTLGCLQTVAIALGIREFNYSTRQIVSAFPRLFKRIVVDFVFGFFRAAAEAIPEPELEIAT